MLIEVKNLRLFLFSILLLSSSYSSFSQEVVENLYVILLPKTEKAIDLESESYEIENKLLKGHTGFPALSSGISHTMVIRYGHFGRINPSPNKYYFNFTQSFGKDKSLHENLIAAFKAGNPDSLNSTDNKISYFNQEILLSVLYQVHDFNIRDSVKVKQRQFYKNIYLIKVLPPVGIINYEKATDPFGLKHLNKLFSEVEVYRDRENKFVITNVQIKENLKLSINDDFLEMKWESEYATPTLSIRPVSETIMKNGVEKTSAIFNGFDNSSKPYWLGETSFKNTAKNIREFAFEGDSLVISSAEISLNKKIELFDSVSVEVQMLTNYFIGENGDDTIFPLAITLQTDWATADLITQNYQFGWLFFVYILILLTILFFVFRYRHKALLLAKKSIETKMKLYSLKQFTDDYETANYKGTEVIGKIKGSYYAWEANASSVKDAFNIEIEGGLFNFGSETITVTIEDLVTPEGFSVNLKKNSNDLRQYALNQPLQLQLKKNSPETFWVEFHRNDFQNDLKDVQRISFSLRVYSKKEKYNVFVRENYFFGPELGNAWIGYDPGTTGTCLAAGLTSDKIEFYQEANSKIIASVIAIQKAQTFTYIKKREDGSPERPVYFSDFKYEIGNKAERYLGGLDYTTFQSVKKLLGFKNKFAIKINDLTFKMNGKQLTHLLISKLFKQFRDQKAAQSSLSEASRCVVALPNNFTATKTQDLLDAFRQMNQFKEIRYIYESEAVAFKYLSEYAKHNSGKSTPTNDNILVFDMGGATINVSLLNVKYESEKYIVDVLGKMGYGIGGDTIDYCLIKDIAEEIEKLTGLKQKPFETKESIKAWWKFVKEIKNKLVKNREKSTNAYITPTDLEQFINLTHPNSRYLNSVNAYTSEISERLFNKTSPLEFVAFSKNLENIILSNVRDITKEIVLNPADENSGQNHIINIDAVVFSGRSTHFPRIKKEVLGAITANQIVTPKEISFSLDDAKTAVAFGACWYGLSKGSILRSDLKTGSSFGVKYKRSGDASDIAYEELIGRNIRYDKSTHSLVNEKDFEKSLTYDNNLVSFYQVMGKNPEEILKKLNNQHKFSLVGQLTAKMKLNSIGMEVFENDKINYFIRLNDNTTRNGEGTLGDLEIKEQNAEHYTWMFDDQN